jgi:PAS domain S-box-containing protein
MKKHSTSNSKVITRVIDRIFVRNYALFFLVLVLFAGWLLFNLINGNRSITETSAGVTHTREVIISSEKISTMVEAMLAAQRGYILSGNKELLEQYETKRENLSAEIAKISEMIADNPSQASRVDEIRDYSTRFATKLEERTARYKPIIGFNEQFMDEIQVVTNLKDSILNLNMGVLKEEYSLLRARIQKVEALRTYYFRLLLTGISASLGILILFNSFLLRSQKKRNSMEAALYNSERRFSLAVAGTQDGIFDWNLRTDEVFYSGQLFRMLGYDRQAFTGTLQDLKDIMHPEDAPMVWKTVNDYLENEIPEYAPEFRLKGKKGEWIWIKSRAKAIMGADGKPERMVGAHTDITLQKEIQNRLETEKRIAEETT